jgi:primosomal protein N' (replication factor Y)
MPYYGNLLFLFTFASMKYVEVILPLPLEGYFTYAAGDLLVPKIKPGVRLVVPFGKTKLYTAVALAMHDNKPDFDVKEVISVLDEAPILFREQLKLWKWIAEYYISPIGDVYKAALPAGLKSDERFKPKTETYINLTETYRNEQVLHIALNTLQRAPKQQNVLCSFLELSHWDTLEGGIAHENIVDITRDELMNSSHSTVNVIKALCSRNILYTYEKEIGRLNNAGDTHFENIKPLNAPQADACNSILMQMQNKNVVLLHGVTSSGKTEIYIHLIKKAIDEGKQVLYLLPEIALTVQITERLQNVFGNRLGIYHSKYSDAERVEIWKKQLSDSPYDVILGARSAVFLPFKKLGLVVVDEEHETSFKQQDPAPRYHARSAAIVLAQMYGAKTLLGTATPSMESFYNAQLGKYGLVELKTRYKGIELPKIQIVDIRDLQHRKMMNGPFSPQLLAAVKEALQTDKQVILFQNRRGFAPMIECKECGWVPKCTNCDVSLTYHKSLNQLTCHYCGFTYTVPTVCPNCGSMELIGRGYGTEKIEDQIRDIFPEARVARMDLDTTRTRHAYQRIISDFSSGKTNLLIGTQMISKGLDFDKVSVVGILNADSMLNYPDFRAYEHAFMMMSQVSGRAGRKGKRGQVYLQTKSPELPVIQQVVHNDFSGFTSCLLEERRYFHYPPFFHLIYVYLKHNKKEIVESASLEMGSRLHQYFADRILGPDKPAVARVKTMEIRKIVIKLENGIDLNKVRETLRYVRKQIMQDKRRAALQIYFDVDPV